MQMEQANSDSTRWLCSMLPTTHQVISGGAVGHGHMSCPQIFTRLIHTVVHPAELGSACMYISMHGQTTCQPLAKSRSNTLAELLADMGLRFWDN